MQSLELDGNDHDLKGECGSGYMSKLLFSLNNPDFAATSSITCQVYRFGSIEPHIDARGHACQTTTAWCLISSSMLP